MFATASRKVSPSFNQHELERLVLRRVVLGGPHHRLCLRPSDGYYNMLLMFTPPPRKVSPFLHQHELSV